MNYAEEDDIIDRYRNWPIRVDDDGDLSVTINGVQLYCTDINDAHKEIDKAIKSWGRKKALGL